MSFNTKLFKLIPYLIVALVFFLPAIDSDLGWHLRYGNYFLETGRILRENTLTYYLSGHLMDISYTLYQILTALIYSSAGLLGLAIAFSLLMVSIFWVFSQISQFSPYFNLLFFLLASWLGWGVFSLAWRAQVFTILGILL